MKNLQQAVEGYDYCITNLAQKLNIYICANLSPYRYDHSLTVAKISLELGKRENLPKHTLQKLLLAALAHDITKEKPVKFHMDIFKKYRVLRYLKLPPTIYHAKSAPYYIQEQFKIKNDEIAHAIFFHSTGCKNMPLFSRIIFSADYLASLKLNINDSIFSKSTAELCFDKNNATLNHLLSKKMPVQPDSVNFYNILLQELAHGKKIANLR
ncbi:MAG: HD domain-containing protein [Spirochaetia bacterium]|nr:HD domain-containing protein [Spirochaetia bacterium]